MVKEKRVTAEEKHEKRKEHGKMRFGISAIARGVVVLALAVVSQSWGAESGGQAMMILHSLDFADTQKTIAALEKEGVRPVHVIPPRVVIGFVPAEAEVRAAGIGNVVSIYRSAAPAIGPEEGADLATGVSVWNHLVSRRGAAPAGIPPGAAPLVGDAFEPPMPEFSQFLTGREGSALPGYYSTSEFMIGKVAVGVILPESNGSGENWSSARQQEVYNEIVEGLNWWATKGGSAAPLTFYYEWQLGVPTQYEPITLRDSDEDTWVSDIFANMGYTSGNCFDRGRAYINNIRNDFGTDWSYAFIVADSLNDADGVFADGQYFAWAHIGGPYSIMTYDNQNYGISNMNIVAAHESGHIFLAADEYCQPGYWCCDFGYYGYLNIYNGNCEDGNPSSVPCIMRRSEDVICQWTNGQIGWQDTDGDGVPDTIDNVVNNTLNPYPTPATEPILTLTGNAVDVPCVSQTRTNVTINRILTVKYRVDGGAWADANAADGAFDEDVEDYSFTVGPLGKGLHRIETQAYSTSGNVSSVAGQDVKIQLYGGGSGTQANPYRVSTVTHWQNLMNTSADWNKYFILTADVDLQGVFLTPVGNYSQPFYGVFDGNDRIIRNVVVNMPDSDYVGLFGYVRGYIHNLGVDDIVIIGGDNVGGLVGFNLQEGNLTGCYASGSVLGNSNVGGLVGQNMYGTLFTCYASGSASGESCTGGLVGYNQEGDIISCYATGSVIGVEDSENVGGLIGYNLCFYGYVYNCYATGSVSGCYGVGGLIGWNYHGRSSVSPSRCYAIGPVYGNDRVGGLVGCNNEYSTINNCYSTGLVNGNIYVGGLVGENWGTLFRCYATGFVNGSRYAGGLVGRNELAGGVMFSFWDMQTSNCNTSAGGIPKTTDEMKTKSTFIDATWDFVGETANGTEDIWSICEGTNYPRFVWQIQAADWVCPDGVGFEDFSYLADGWQMEFGINDLMSLCEQWLTGR